MEVSIFNAMEFYDKYSDKIAWRIKVKWGMNDQDCINDIKQIMWESMQYLIGKYTTSKATKIETYLLNYLEYITAYNYLKNSSNAIESFPSYKIYKKDYKIDSYISLDNNDVESDKMKLWNNKDIIENIDFQVDTQWCVKKILQSLKERDKRNGSYEYKVIILLLNGYNQSQIAKRLGLSQMRISSKLKAIIKYLNKQKYIKEYKEEYIV